MYYLKFVIIGNYLVMANGFNVFAMVVFAGTNLVVNILAFGDSLTRGYYNKGKNHHPYTMKLQYLLNKMDAKRCFIVENEGRDGDVAFGEMPKRMEEVYKEYSKYFLTSLVFTIYSCAYHKVLCV